MRLRITPRTIEVLLGHVDGPQPVVAGRRQTGILARHGLVYFKSRFRPRRSMLTRKGRQFLNAIRERSR